MGNELAQRVAQHNGRTGGAVEQTKPKTLAEQIRGMEEQFKLAMPRGVEARQLVRDALTALRQNPDLAKCTPDSVLGGLMTFAQLGLRPGVLGHGWLIPFEKRGKVGGQWQTTAREAQIVIGYKGLVELVHRSGEISTMVARAVHENDHFELEYGLNDNLVHRPATGHRGNVIGYYAIIKYQSGGYVMWHMSRDEAIEWRNAHAMSARRDRNTGEVKGSGPWFDETKGPAGGTGFDQMALKGLALDTPIPTPSGWTTMGDVAVGDMVIDRHGQPTRVLVKSEVKHLDCYRMTFANGESIVCDAEHLWVARAKQHDAYATSYKIGPRDQWPVYTIGELYEAKQRGRQITVPVVEPVELPDADLPVDPWVLGYWLGDGSSRVAVVTCNVDNVNEITAAIGAAGYEVGTVRRDPRSRGVTVGIRSGLTKQLAELGVLGHKHVPDVYLRGSVRQRLALLRGLVDSDGSLANKRGRASFFSTDLALADSVAELARSLGEMVTRHSTQTHGFGKDVVSHSVNWQPTVAPVTLAAKLARFRPREMAPYRSVASIERIESVPTQCIGVDALSHTFLAGRGWVPTHNTCALRAMRWAPKATDTAFAKAAEVDGSVRLNVDTHPDGMLQAEYPTREDVIDGELADDDPAPTPQQQPPQQQAPAGDPVGPRSGSSLAADVPAPGDGPGEQRLQTEFDPVPGDGSDAPAVKSQLTQIHTLLGKGDTVDTDEARHAVLGRMIGLGRPVKSAAELTRREASQVADYLKAWDKAGALAAQLAALVEAVAAPADDGAELPPVGSAAWHEAGHPERTETGKVVTVPQLLNGDCGFCEEDHAAGSGS